MKMNDMRRTKRCPADKNVRSLTRGALIAAIYLLLTLLMQPLSFGAIQLRAAEALTMLCLRMSGAPLGLFVGCLLSNLLGEAIWYDVVFGSLATLLSALLVRRFRQRPYLAAAMPALCNGLIVGPIVYFAYVQGSGAGLLLAAMATVALGELVACYALGLPLLRALKRLPERYFES